MAEAGDNGAAQPETVTAPEQTRPSRRKRILQAVASTVVVVGIFVGVLPQFADYADVWDTIRAMSGFEVAGLTVVSFWNLATYWFLLVAALPGLRLREAAVVNQASTAVSNTLPGGGALGVGVTVAMLSSWGFTLASIARQALVTGVWNAFVKLGMPVLALALLAVEGDVTPPRLAAATVGLGALAGSVVGLALVMKSNRLARSIGRGFGKVANLGRRLVRKEAITDWGDRAVEFRRNSFGLVRHRWVALTVAGVLSHVSLYIVLLVVLRAVGIGQAELSWIAVLAAFAFVRLISALPVTPGGVGVVELGYVATLTLGLDEASRAQVVAAVLLFRAITFFIPIPLGATAYVVWRRNRSWKMSREERSQLTREPATAA